MVIPQIIKRSFIGNAKFTKTKMVPDSFSICLFDHDKQSNFSPIRLGLKGSLLGSKAMGELYRGVQARVPRGTLPSLVPRASPAWFRCSLADLLRSPGSSGAIPCFAPRCFAQLCFALLRFASLCLALLNFAWLCLALLCFASLRFALLCFVLLYIALLCFALLSFA